MYVVVTAKTKKIDRNVEFVHSQYSFIHVTSVNSVLCVRQNYNSDN